MFIKNFEINTYMNVFNKLISCDKFKDVVLQFSIFKVYNELKQEQNLVIEFRKRLESEFFETDDLGNVVFQEKDPSVPKLKKGKTDKDYIKKLTDILNEKVEIKAKLNIKLEDLQPLADEGVLIPSDFEVLHNFIVE